MATDTPTAGRARRLRFGPYILDRDRGCLFDDGAEVRLRPKTFAVLDYLVENRGRLVSKDELFAAVWTGLAVTDDTLVQSVGELRRALGGDGPRLIRTAPRRGYLFDAEVSSAPAPPAVADDTPVPSGLREEGRPAERVAASTAPRQIGAGRRAAYRGAALAALVLVLVAGVLWGSVWSGWRSFHLSRQTGRFAADILGSAGKPAIAVLPFANESGDPARNYLADGLTQDVIDALGRFPELTVMSWNAVEPYRAQPATPGDVARALGVRYQVEGNARQGQAGDRMRVDARLVDRDGRVIWSARFDERLTDVFGLPDEITAQIAGSLAIRVTEAEQRRAFAKPTDSLEAYDCMLRARPALQRPDRAGIVAARELLRRAIALDANYAAPYSALAESYYIAVSMGWAESPARFLDRAQTAAAKALNIDDSDVRAHVILGRIDIFYHHYDQARAEMDRAIAFNPNDARALAGRGNALMWSGQTDAAIKALEAAQRLDPELNPMDRFALGLAYYLRRRYDASIEQDELNLRKVPAANFSRIILAAAYAEEGRTEDAARVVADLRRFDPAFDFKTFGSKFLDPDDLEHLREGVRKAGLELSGN
jgi:adenylate cyclase